MTVTRSGANQHVSNKLEKGEDLGCLPCVRLCFCVLFFFFVQCFSFNPPFFFCNVVISCHAVAAAAAIVTMTMGLLTVWDSVRRYQGRPQWLRRERDRIKSSPGHR
jgi:hypothetical protein